MEVSREPRSLLPTRDETRDEETRDSTVFVDYAPSL